MKTLLALSPHLDDAAFSISPLLAELSTACRVIVATPFAGSVADAAGFALACQLDKGLSPEVDYMALRRREDAAWAAAIDVEVVHGDLTEAPHRGYESAAALFSGIHADDHLKPILGAWLRTIVANVSPELVLLPLGIGGHVDHLWLRQLAEASFEKMPLAYYGDQPYCAKQGLALGPGKVPEASGLEAFKVYAGASAVDRSMDAAAVYLSQIPFQFGTFEKMRSILGEAWSKDLCLFSTQANHSKINEIIRLKFN